MALRKIALPSLLALLLAGLAAPAFAQPAPSGPREEAPEPPSSDAKDPVTECNEFMEAYLKSASRKLYRSLSGHGFNLQTIKLQSWMDLRVEVDGESKTASFALLREKDGKIAALIDSNREVRRTWVLANTGAGPLITSFTWPQPDAIDSQADCRPIRSRIDYPKAPLSRIVDIEPFKFWGLRLLWRLPADFKPGASTDDDRSLFQVVRDVVRGGV